MAGTPVDDLENGTSAQPRQARREPQDFVREEDFDDEPSRSTAGDIRFPGLDPNVVPRHIQQMVARMHLSYGHPPKKEFLRFAARQGASSRVLQAISALLCPSCVRAQKPPSQLQTMIPRVGQMGDHLYSDLFYSEGIDGHSWCFMMVLDQATSLGPVRRPASREPDDIWITFEIVWLTPYGIPVLLTVDLDGAYRGEFEDKCLRLGIDIRFVPPGAHYENRAESHIAIWKRIFERVVDFMAASTPDEIDVCVLATSHAKHLARRRGGRNAYTASFGRVPRLPGDLLADGSSAAVWENISQDAALRYAEEARVTALREAANVEGDNAIKAAILRKTTAMKEFDPQPAQRVAV